MKGLGIQARSIRHSFAGTGQVIDGLDLEVEPGEFVALLGPSGCGKSTFLRILAGLENAESGSVRLASGEGARPSSGFVFQDSTLIPWRNALKNVRLPLELAGVASEEAESRARAGLAQVGLESAALKFPHELSGGMKMRVSVARALVTQPSVLFLDEPFSALDEFSRHELQDELRAIWKDSEMTVLFVTHSVAEAVYLAGRVVILSGRPARIVRDVRIGLGNRTQALRSSPAYFEQIRVIYEATSGGGSLP